MELEDNYQFRQAFDLVKTALQSGAISLIGPKGSAFAGSNGEADAKYLTALLKGLTANLPGSSM